MKKYLFLSFIIPLLLTSCGGNEPTSSSTEEAPKFTRIEDKRNLDIFDYTLNNLSATDDYGRLTPVTNIRKKDKKIGIFYHVWHGYHNTGIFNITELLANDPDSLWDPDGNENSPMKAFHYWGEPLYGYYNSSDPWVITRHMELFTMAGVDYLVYDLTNTVIYVDAINAIFKVLDVYQKQGFAVPKIAFYTNSESAKTIKRCYDLWYKPGLYSNLWFSLDGEKPLIIGQKDDIRNKFPDEADEILNFFQIKESQWPDATRFDRHEGFPWMDWEYPQRNYDGTMSVSLAQHPGMKMSEESATNHGRGFNYEKFINEDEHSREGTNVEGQWKTVFDNINKVNNVFVTGWNEWIAQKMTNGEGHVFFVDTFNENYSRDMEMYRDGYKDNFYLQLTRNIRKFAFENADHYIYKENTIDIANFEDKQWENITSKFIDFDGDAMKRDFVSADKVNHLLDDTNRNDIVKSFITHDKDNLYLRVETSENITSPENNDKSWMNVLINTGTNTDNLGGFDYIVNRSRNGNKASLERLTEDRIASKVGDVDFAFKDNVIQFKIPLNLINKNSEDFHISFKVSDNIQEQNDILDYYISGDSAPIGRLGYDYGF